MTTSATRPGNIRRCTFPTSETASQTTAAEAATPTATLTVATIPPFDAVPEDHNGPILTAIVGRLGA
ncbi:hypothetical protein GCM10009828_040380 [Actinoplanes couchii]|uniref:Uncharacterized protein n=1 Tax=Actinoplanes couchii TaxID=403638 RepID=A0ABQ3XGI5_9ACTN|nr:hypothetical protein Aco03nite_060130 [Actinoplanes couchii]